MRLSNLKALAPLDKTDFARLARSAFEAQTLEDRWLRELRRALQRFTAEILEGFENYREIDRYSIDFEAFFMEHSFAVQKEAIEKAESDRELYINPEQVSAEVRLARGPAPAKVSRNIRDLMAQYDRWRKKGGIPKRQKEFGERVKREYLKKVQDVYLRYSSDFRSGDVVEKERAVEALQKAADTTFGRAKTIVETETTNWYNQARKQVYDQSPDVVGYFFVAIRDAATTHWCRTRMGLVYHRGDPHLEKEVPPCHWNCRSELLPLTRQNPRHLVLLDNPSRDRRNNRPAPLPKGWNSTRI